MNDGEDPVKWRARADALKAKHMNGNGAGMPLAVKAAGWPTPHGLNAAGGQGGGEFDKAVRQWSTLRTITGGGESAERKKELGREGAGGGDLQAQTKQWSTPSVADTQGGRLSRSGGRSGVLLLQGQAKQTSGVLASAWPTPGARDHKGSIPLHRRNRTMGTLDEAAEQRWTSPSSPPAPTTLTHGELSLPPSLTSRPLTTHALRQTFALLSGVPFEVLDQVIAEAVDARLSDLLTTLLPHLAKRRLNPRFVEWLMGWPPGWTSLAPIASGSEETGSCRFKRRLQSEFWRIVSAQSTERS
ncbi:MAG: hypothetical protein AAGI68_11790 [Planctomycetota bacterium]